MPILVHITKQAMTDCTTHGIQQDRLSQLAKRIETLQELGVFDRHYPYPSLIKKKWPAFDKRLVAIQKTVQNDTVIVFLRVLIRGSREYDNNFSRSGDTLQYVTSQYENEMDDDSLASIVEQRNSVDPPTELQEATPQETNFLWSGSFQNVQDETLVLESHEFVDDIGRPDLTQQLVRIPEMVLNALEADTGAVQLITCAQNSDLALLAYNSPSRDQCVLLRMLHADPHEDRDQIKREWLKTLGGADHTEILRHCRVSYPALVCADETIWVSLHDTADDSEHIANLSLSPEEGDLLFSCHRHEGDNTGFPLFINGRAGSGKSTLLQFLFASSFQSWRQVYAPSYPSSSCPLYMASSNSLLDVARRSAESILTLNSEQLIEGKHLPEAARTTLSACFKQTADYMHSLLPAEDKDRYPLDTRVTYATFRRLWERQFSNEPRALRDHGPQISWHIIRGLIKGFSPGALLDANDYSDLPKDERSVSKATFDVVYDRVWDNWYKRKCSEEGRWDDQDLVRHLIDHDLLPKTHVAIFCDEAQDFTRVELEAIYKCSLFSNRSLDRQSIKRVPFVFVGDPFQTLNPTGFRWESVQAAFTERIVEALHRFDARNRRLPQLHYKELTFNYRSTKQIVHFCNSLQASRAFLFDHSSLQPQSTWRIQGNQSAPVFLDKADIQVKQSLKEQSDLVFIVPCEEDEETDYVAQDGFLKDIVVLDDEGVPMNVQSAARSKGLEFSRVALYGWSEPPEATRIADLLTSSRTPDVEIDEQLKLEYFMNNLYVAASRAMKRLFVLDDESSLDALWWIVNDKEHIDTLLKGLPDSWKEKVGTMVSGGSESFQFDQDTNKRRAEQQKKEGISKQDPYALKQAAQYYELDGNHVEANRCRGIAFRYSERYEDSAKHFEEAGDYADVVEMLWKGRHYSDIVHFTKRQPKQASLPECRVAALLSDRNATPHEYVEVLTHVATAIGSDEDRTNALGTPVWSNAIEQVLKKARTSISNATEATKILGGLGTLIDHGLSLDSTVLAPIHFHAKDYAKVVELLADEPSSELYRTARAASLLAQDESGDHPISESDAEIVGDYLSSQVPPQFGRASEYYSKSEELAPMINCFKAADSDDLAVDELGAVVRNTINCVLKHSDWGLLASILVGSSARILKVIATKELNWRVVVPFLARSMELSNDTGQDKQRIQGYLKKLVGNRDWKQRVKPKVMGSAIERAGKDIDALVFYESLFNAPEAEKRLIRYAEIRWVVCKLRQADRKNSTVNRNEAQRIIDKRGWDPEVLNEDYPAIKDDEHFSTSRSGSVSRQRDSALPSPHVLRDRQTETIGSLKFSLFSSNGWINIESEDGLQARVIIAERRIVSDDVKFKKTDVDSDHCSHWELRVDWMPEDSITFSCDGQELKTPPITDENG